MPQLPKSARGKPKPAAPWIAGIIYWIANQPRLQALTGLSVTPAADGRPAEFVRRPLASGQSDRDAGQAIVGLIREVLRACGSGLKLQGWNAVAKQLRGDTPNPALAPGETQIEPQQRKKWWENCYRGGNVWGDHSQTFVELAPELFLMQTIMFEKEKPGLLRLATETWLQQFMEAGQALSASPGIPAAATTGTFPMATVSRLDVRHAGPSEWEFAAYVEKEAESYTVPLVPPWKMNVQTESYTVPLVTSKVDVQDEEDRDALNISLHGNPFGPRHVDPREMEIAKRELERITQAQSGVHGLLLGVRGNSSSEEAAGWSPSEDEDEE
eukprot:COSAG06_NODE_1991_length_7895_cov_3.685736_7_plen_327_part_00